MWSEDSFKSPQKNKKYINIIDLDMHPNMLKMDEMAT